MVASGCPAAEFTAYVDTLSFCLSKGLGAPFGALLCGSRALIERAVTFRQMLGGGMRQAGIMAAAGIVALQTGIERLADDHAHARALAAGLAEMFPGSCDPGVVETNLFFIQTAAFGMSGDALAEHLAANGILVFAGQPRMRLATHVDVTGDDVAEVLQVFAGLRRAQAH